MHLIAPHHTSQYTEIKHARLAMLAAVGWPASELSHFTLAKILGLENLLAPNGRAPSVLNGGLNNDLVIVMICQLCTFG